MTGMNVTTIAVITVVVALLAVMLRQQRPEQALLLTVAAGSLITIALVSYATPLYEEIRDLFSQTGLSGEYIQVLFKGLGICLVTQLASDTCKEAGELSMASKAELVGRTALLIVGFPLFEKITAVAVSLING